MCWEHSNVNFGHQEVLFQPKDGVTSEIDGWFGRSFASAAVRAAIGSAGSGAAMAGCDQRRAF